MDRKLVQSAISTMKIYQDFIASRSMCLKSHLSLSNLFQFLNIPNTNCNTLCMTAIFFKYIYNKTSLWNRINLIYNILESQVQ